MFKGTPGPWEACERGDYDDFEGNSRIINGDDMRVAVVHDHGSPGCTANARLIAAAPELLEALSGMLMACGMAAGTGDPIRPGDPALVAARAAMAKATQEAAQ